MSSNMDTRLLDKDQQQSSCGRCIERCCHCKLTNKTVLLVVCIMFAIFAVSEIIGAAAGNSYSLLGDASATALDAITYYCNYYAETQAQSDDSTNDEERGPDAVGAELGAVGEGDRQSPGRHAQSQNNGKAKLMHEVYVPAFSVLTLVIVTVFMLALQIHTLASGSTEETNLMIMYLFASINMAISVTSMTLFYLVRDDVMKGRRKKSSRGSGTSNGASGDSPRGDSEQNGQKKEGLFSSANLNMFAAVTHVGSDILRTIAIFAGAIVASTTGIENGVCDAWAGVVVSITIFIAMLPLSKEVYDAYQDSRKG